MIVSFDSLIDVIYEKLIKLGADDDIARITAETIAENDLDGVSSHGTGRFTRLASMINDGKIKLNERAQCVVPMGSFEVWDAKLGNGVTNARLAMARAVELAGMNGIGCVAMRNANHWLRGGSYGIQAAQAGCVGICWTTTAPNMPPWGSVERTIGNNPLIFAVPFKGSYVMVDGAMALFSYGAIENAIRAGKQLPLPGGYDTSGELTTDPIEISKTWRVLPIGYWKGSGFSILLDMIASGLSGGKTISQIGEQGGKPTDEYNLCQVFIAIRPSNQRIIDEHVERIIESVKNSKSTDSDGVVYYPGEKTKSRRESNLRNGILVNDKIWQEILEI